MKNIFQKYALTDNLLHNSINYGYALRNKLKNPKKKL